MSRIGREPVVIPSGVTAKLAGSHLTVTGKLGTLEIDLRPEVSVTIDEENKQIRVARQDDEKKTKAFHGMTRALINNMVVGVTEGFKKELEINGVGYGAKLQGNKLELSLGYADKRIQIVPQGVTVEVNNQRVVVSGIDKQLVGQFAAAVRAERKPEPYNMKGVKYVDEVVLRKEGKAFAGGG